MRRCAALLLLLALAGCGGSKQAGGLSVAQIVDRTIAKTGAQTSFHFRLKVTNPAPSTQGLSLTFADGDLLVPDRLKADVAGTFQGIPLTSQIVFTGPRQFLKNPLSGAWQTFATKTSPIAYFNPAKGVLAVVKGAVQLKLAGSQTVGGVDAYKLVGKVRARDLTAILGNPPSDRLADVELLVGKSDLLLRELRLDGPVASTEPAGISRVVDLSKFGEQVTIEAPAAT